MTQDTDSNQFWEQKYAAGHQQRYPWDSVVSFVFRYASKDRPPAESRILELGFGTGSNLWFAAREGFAVSGIEASASAVKRAHERFRADGLSGDLRVGSFTALPFPDAHFDLVVDRCSLTCVEFEEIARALNELARVAKPGAYFFFNPYADGHSSFEQDLAKGRTVKDVARGTLTGVKQITFVSRADVYGLLRQDWDILSLQRLELTDMQPNDAPIHAEWRAIARRR
jgi:SAM-dependent methyltransferase